MDDRLSVLITKAAIGDQTAFHEIVKTFEPLIAGIIKKYGIRNSDYDEDDLRQEATIALFGAVRTYNRTNYSVTFGLYAKICISNRIISHLRKIRHNIIPITIQEPDDIDGIIDSSGKDFNPENEIIGRESYNTLLNLIDKNLTPYEKSVFKLYILDKSYQEIAAVLGSSQKSVDNAIYRIKKKIKKLI